MNRIKNFIKWCREGERMGNFFKVCFIIVGLIAIFVIFSKIQEDKANSIDNQRYYEQRQREFNQQREADEKARQDHIKEMDRLDREYEEYCRKNPNACRRR